MNEIFEVKIISSQGNGSFGSPLTNTPYGYTIIKNGEVVDHWARAFGSYKSALDFAVRVKLKNKPYREI